MATQGNFFDLDRAIANLVQRIKTYSSDTFDATELDIDDETAKQMAAWLIHSLLFAPDGVEGDAIDGAVLGLALDNVIEVQTSQTAE